MGTASSHINRRVPIHSCRGIYSGGFVFRLDAVHGPPRRVGPDYRSLCGTATSSHRLASLAPGAWGYADEFLEGPIESGLGFVAHFGACIGEACALFDETRRKLEAPARHILHRRDLDELGEPAGKGGARKSHLSAYGPEAERLRERLRDARPKAEANLARLVALAER